MVEAAHSSSAAGWPTAHPGASLSSSIVALALALATVLGTGCSAPGRNVTSIPARPVDSSASLPRSATTLSTLPASQAPTDRSAPGPQWGGAEWVVLDLETIRGTEGWLQGVRHGPDGSCELVGPGGRALLTPHQPTMLIEGLQCYLGFRPSASNGVWLIHRRDLEKNVRPLLQAATPPSLPNRTIVVDPGHGGSNSGARSAQDGRLEKEFTLDWGLRVAALLREQGWEVVLTRTNDQTLSLAERVAIADAAQASLFLSLHFNSAGSSAEHQGIETYCLTPWGLPSTITRGYEDDPSQTYANNAYDDANVAYAFQLHRALVQACAGEDRGIRRARFTGVIRDQARPAVLLEGGYLSNPAEAQRIADPEHRECLARAVVQALGTPAPTLASSRSKPVPASP